MSEPVRIIGGYISPYVRKVLVCLDLKGIPYEIDPIVPFFGDDRFSKLSPLRRIPVLIDDRVKLCDSSVICQYLEDRYPAPALYPEDVATRAHARWLEEFADTRMGDVLIWGLFNQVTINPFVWGKPTDEKLLRKILEDDIPSVLDYLETQVPGDGFLFGTIGVADVAIASFFRNAAFARFQIDTGQWPMTAAFVERALSHASFRKLMPFENKLIRTPIAQHRAVLSELGAPLSAETYFTEKPRKGMMNVT